jgi:hypothetical protein
VQNPNSVRLVELLWVEPLNLGALFDGVAWTRFVWFWHGYVLHEGIKYKSRVPRTSQMTSRLLRHTAVAMRAHNVLCNSYNTRPLLCARITCYVTVITVEINHCSFHRVRFYAYRLYYINVWHVYEWPKTYTWSGTFILKDGRYTFTFFPRVLRNKSEHENAPKHELSKQNLLNTNLWRKSRVSFNVKHVVKV